MEFVIVDKDYKGYTVAAVPSKNNYIVFPKDDPETNSNTVKTGTYEECKQFIDKQGKKGFERIPCWDTDHGVIREVEVTSITDRGEAWVVVKEGKRREKLWRSGELYVRSEKNDLLAMEILELHREIASCEKNIERLKRQFEKGKIDELTKERR